ncbi:uncharacterized protein V1516DRAFT_680600 [Lipomyces oligophaga]|uniref:uncharacterized protein n=1 Tax=Lipomyces oligophaga TaxID=45792 RepID=UPI0034CE4A9A
MVTQIPLYENAANSYIAPWIGDDLSLTPEQKALRRFSLSGKSALITGGARGLGFDAAFALLEHGASKVALLDISDGSEAVAHLQKLHPTANIVYWRVNVTDADMVDKVVSELAELFGQLDILLSFAGIVNCEFAIDHSPETWRRVLDVNTTGTFLIARAFGKCVIKNGNRASVVLTASMSGHGANFPQPQSAYNASKAAVISIKTSLAAEWAMHNIRVNSISPGYMDTVLNEGDALDYHRRIWLARTPLNRMGARGDLNGAIILLSSDAGSFITGSDIMIDGGITGLI